ncbi:uncharacterized protein N7515_009643 [Penicillium bovifimosum]|uniref:RNA ligase/cyclic nucleotide phosphodiesterase n=1 Tax=Penicillium bovifimosum TaxID=126998 RepID=A0A9W9GJQ0_9EURO|nr:uncharacterized protein N7515_009643 [Penicillium bovifimosum]KAJ5121682.1 hypothetical protein N7515_009643 [Penicillium bovifimosum]
MTPLPVSENNPFQSLIRRPAIIQSEYEEYREDRKERQTDHIVSGSFHRWSLDKILMQLNGPKEEYRFLDPRNCLCIWARPSSQVHDLITFVQEKLKDLVPSLWLMPPDCLHMTVLEIAYAQSEWQIEELVRTLQSSKDVTPSDIAAYPRSHPVRLVKPMLSLDTAGLSLTFVPAVIEDEYASPSEHYTYHHLRRDIFELVQQAKVPLGTRYRARDLTSAYVTIARFISHDGFSAKVYEGEMIDHRRVRSFVEEIDLINMELENKYWPRKGEIKEGG